MRRSWDWIKTKFQGLIDVIKPIGSLVLSIVVIFGFVVALLAATCYVELVTDKVSFLFPFKVLNAVFDLSDKSVTTEVIYTNREEFQKAIEIIVNIFVAVSSLMLYLFSLISYFRKVANINKKSSFHKRKVLVDGVEDVQEMLKSFRGADYIAIFSSTYNWISKNNEMVELLKEAAGKNELVLFTKEIDKVSKNLKIYKDIDSALRKTPIEGLLHLSYVERNNARYIIYRQEEDLTKYVITVKENSDSRYLIDIISRIVKATV